MNIDSIRNGYVLDHIKAGASMEIYRLLGLDKLDCSVAIIKNAKSTKLGRKDIIKIDALIDLIWTYWAMLTRTSPCPSSRTVYRWKRSIPSCLRSWSTCCAARTLAASPPPSPICPLSLC